MDTIIIVVLLLIGTISPIIVYLDATKQKIAAAGTWAIFVLLIWIIGLPVYLFKRKKMIEKAKEAPVIEEQRALKTLVLSLACLLLFFSMFYLSFKDGLLSADDTQQAQSSIIPVCTNKDTFDVVNKAVSLNCNLEVAIKKINQMGIHSIGDTATQTTAEAVTKSPYSALGKAVKLTGKVYKVEELPPGDHPGHWSEILIITNNPNSPAGVTTVDFLFNGDISKIRSGQVITCSGYFVGTFLSTNAMGGHVEALAMVGNEAR
jgi:hypothetical protein